MKFKKLIQSQILISIDRLTRFKPAEEKYLRVFCDIILSALIEPKYKKNDVLKLDYKSIRNIAVEIFNSSLDDQNTDLRINTILKDYENSVFNNNANTRILLENELNYAAALNLIEAEGIINLDWLKYISLNNVFSSGGLRKLREEHNLLYPIEKVVIAEGITEEILLPEFARCMGYDFNKYGIKVIAAGGKNQVVKLYYKLSQELKIPIFVLMDKDAKNNEKFISSRLRPIDDIYILESGEFEDMLPKSLIAKTINNEFKNFISINTEELSALSSTVETLEEFYKNKGSHEFKKHKFACRLKPMILSDKDISAETKNIINKIKTL